MTDSETRDAPTPALRRATPGDGPGALAFVSSILAEFGLPADAHEVDEDLGDIDRHYFSRGGDFVVLADAAGEIVGTCGLHPLSAESVELRKMYLHPSLRGRGHGRRMLEWAFRRARELGFRRMTLETATVLTDAIALYERNGFKPDPSARHSCRCDRAYSRAL